MLGGKVKPMSRSGVFMLTYCMSTSSVSLRALGSSTAALSVSFSGIQGNTPMAASRFFSVWHSLCSSSTEVAAWISSCPWSAGK